MTQGNWMLVAVIVVLVVIVSGESKKEALLDAGAYNVDASCTWATNVDPQDSRYTSFGNSGAWITMDKDGDGVWEKYGRYSGGSSSQSFPVIIANYNDAGDDITSPSPEHTDLRLVAGSSYTSFKLDYGAASEAIIPSCAGEVVTLPQLTVVRDFSTQVVNSGEIFTVEYLVSGLGTPLPDYSFSISDQVSGGCTVVGSTSITTTIQSPNTKSTSVTVQAPSSGTCTFSGTWKQGSDAPFNFPNQVVSVLSSSNTCWSYAEMIQQLNDNWVSC